MNDPFDHLEQQLRSRVADRAAPRRGRVRSALRRTPLLAVAGIGLAAAGGGALAATSLHHGGDAEYQGRDVSAKVEQATRTLPECKPLVSHSDAKAGFVDAAPHRAISDALPWIEIAPTAQDSPDLTGLRMMLRNDAPILRSTVHAVDLDGPFRALVFVSQGLGWFGASDPKGCRALRERKLNTLLEGRSAAVRAAAERRVLGRTDALVDAQELSLSFVRSGRNGGGGTGLTISPSSPVARHRRVPHGVMVSTSTQYLGLASSRASRILVRAERPRRGITLPASTRVVKNLWALELPRGTGRIRLTEVAADGTVLRIMHVR